MKDPKHPDRWCPAYVCREGDTFENRGLKEVIFEACEKRKDTQSEEILAVLSSNIMLLIQLSNIWLKINLIYITPSTYSVNMRRKEDICFLGDS